MALFMPFRLSKRGIDSTFGYAAVGGALLWAALPPLGLWPLAWIAPVWWVLLVRRRASCRARSQAPPRTWRRSAWRSGSDHAVCLRCDGRGRRCGTSCKYRGFWIAEVVDLAGGAGLCAGFGPAVARPAVLHAYGWRGFFFWLAGDPLAAVAALGHGPGLAGDVVSTSPFICPCLWAFRGWPCIGLRVPVIVAAPVVWTGLELARAHLLTGMTMASLGHTQYRWIELIQMSDLAGAFGVSFLVMFVAACLARMLPCDGQPPGGVAVGPGRWCLAAAVVYGHVALPASIRSRAAGSP